MTFLLFLSARPLLFEVVYNHFDYSKFGDVCREAARLRPNYRSGGTVQHFSICYRSQIKAEK